MNTLSLKLFLFFIVFFCSSLCGFSQTHSFDVIDYKLNFDIYNCFFAPFPASFTASEIITLKAETGLNNITLDAQNESLEIVSVKNVEGEPLNYRHAQNVLEILTGRDYSQ